MKLYIYLWLIFDLPIAYTQLYNQNVKLSCWYLLSY